MSAPAAQPAPSPRPDPAECRCLCGSLIARRVAGGVELKCRRCKRRIVLPLEPDERATACEGRP